MKNPFDSRQLQMFCVLARTGSFTQTAREINVTQSAVSYAIKALESDAGCRLLDRLGKKVMPTQAGEQLLQSATRVLNEMAAARESLARLGKWGGGRLRLGASTTACQLLIPPVLRAFKESFPHHAISVEPGDTPELATALLAYHIDLAISLEVHKEPQLKFHPLFADDLQFIVDPLHAWAKAGRIERSTIPRQNYILYSKRSITFRLITDYFRREEMALNAVIEAGSMEATKEMVKLGLGVSILAPWITQKEIQEGSLVALPLGRAKLQRNWGILHWQGKQLNLAEETFIGLCRSFCATLRHSGKVN